MRLFSFLLIWLVMLAAAFAGGYYAFTQANKQVVQGPLDILPRPRPRPPRPDPEPPPAPLAEDDSRMLARLRLHIEQMADDRATRKIEAAFDEATRKLEQTNPDGTLVTSDEPSQFAFTSLFASALIGFIWKAIKLIIVAIVTSVVIGLLYTWWAWIATAWVAGVTIVAWPIAWAAAKLAQPAKEKA